MTTVAKWWRPAVTSIAFVAITVVAWWWSRQPAFEPRPARLANTLQPEPVAIAPGIYLLGKTMPAAAYLVETSKGLVLIDSGVEKEAAAIIDQITSLGFEIAQLRAVLLTHVHADHSLGADYLRRQTGAKIYAGRADCKQLREGGPREAFSSTFHMPSMTPHATTVDLELEGGESLRFGQTQFKVIPAPGHTPGSVCYLLERPGLRVLFTGDVVLHLSSSTGNTLGTYAAYLPPLYRGSASDFLASLRRLRALPVPDLVLPGHPRMDPTPQNPRLTARHWHALLDLGISELEQALARYAADGADFLDGHPKELLPGLQYLGDFGGSALYCLTTAKDLVLLDAPGGPMLIDFLAQRFRKLGWEGRKPTAVMLTSVDEEATSGLAALVQNSGCQVVAPKHGLEAVQRLCSAETRLLSSADLEKSDWLKARAIPLEGRGRAPVAYQVRWAGKTVLFSGRIPVKPSIPTVERLLTDVTGQGGNVEKYLKSLDRLAHLQPDLWLPAVPVHGQNANVYDQDWAKVLHQNRQVFPPETISRSRSSQRNPQDE